MIKKSIFAITIASLIGLTTLAGSTFAENTASPTPTPSASVSPSPSATPKQDKDKKKSNLNLACVKTAVQKRETATLSAWSTYASSSAAALAVRKSDLSSAWSIEVKKDREKAIKTAWEKFNQSLKKAKKAAKEAKKSIWKTFNSDIKACGKDAAKAVDDLDDEDGDDEGDLLN